ncbi:MAG: hypothetical protein QM535_02895 [Limnohabitans sp.]|nr:hypothetical protein [Limnohabitans sp.]
MFKFIGGIFELVGWFQIMLSPLFIGTALGFGVYYNLPNTFGLILWILLSVLGLIIGVVWATRKYKNSGTISFLSNISATPELDEKTNNQSEKK